MTKPEQFLALRDDACGSHSGCNLWYGDSLEAAGEAWRELSDNGKREVFLTGWEAGTIASHLEMQLRFGLPSGTFACPICGKYTPHEHTGETIVRHRFMEKLIQGMRDERWAEIEKRVAKLRDRP